MGCISISTGASRSKSVPGGPPSTRTTSKPPGTHASHSELEALEEMVRAVFLNFPTCGVDPLALGAAGSPTEKSSEMDVSGPCGVNLNQSDPNIASGSITLVSPFGHLKSCRIVQLSPYVSDGYVLPVSKW